MKNRFKTIFPLLFCALLLLAGCGKTPAFGVITNDDNTIRVNAENGPDGSAAIGYLTVGENEKIVVDANLNDSGKICLRFMAGVLGSDDFPDEPLYESTITGKNSMSFTIEAGDYTVGIIASGKVDGTAVIRTGPAEPAPDGIRSADDEAQTVREE